MQKKINRMPKKAFLPGHLTGEASLPPLGRTGRCEGGDFCKGLTRAREKSPGVCLPPGLFSPTCTRLGSTLTISGERNAQRWR
jgi:hypothetical protein